MAKKYGKAKKYRNFIYVLLAIIVIGLGIYAYNYSISGDKTTSTTGTTDAGKKIGTCNLDVDCNTAPSLTTSVRDALQQGTAVTTGIHYLVNGVYAGTSAPSSYQVCDKVQLIMNASGYIDVETDEIEMQCGNNKMTLDGKESILIYNVSAATIVIKEDSTTLTDSVTAGTSNASAISTGGVDTYEVCFTGSDKDSTGKMLYIWELGATANVSTVNMYDSSGKSLSTGSVPSFYTDTITSPYKKAFIVPSIENAQEKCYSATVAAKSGKHVGGAVYTTVYTGQAFVEDDGSFVDWGVEQDDGDTTYELTYDYDFFIDHS